MSDASGAAGAPRTGSPGVPPPAYLVGAAAGMLALDGLVPLARFGTPLVTALGAALVMAGVALHLRATSHFRRRSTTSEALGEPRILVTDGPYRWTRNPMYLAGLVMLTGLGVVLGSAGPFLMVPVFGCLIRRGYIRREEGTLAERFGEEYDAYRSRVRRWI